MRSSLGLLHMRAFRLVWSSSLSQAGAQWMERVITGWLALGIGGDALAVGAVFSVRLIPFLLFGLVAGTLADRMSRRRICMAVTVAAAALNLGLGLLLARGAVDLWILLAAGLLAGTVQVFDMTTRAALVVDLVGRENAVGAIAVNAVAQRFFGAVGGLAGGMVIPLLGVSAGYLIVAVLYALGFVLLALVREPARPSAVGGPRISFGSALGGTVQLILRNRAVRMVAIASIACELFGYSHQAALPSVARDLLRTGPEGLGQLTAASSIGATLAVIAMTALPPSIRRQPLLSAVLVTWGVALLGLATTTLLGVALAVMLVVGACASAIDVLQQTIAQMSVPEEQRGSAVGVWVFSIGVNVVGQLQVGAVVTLVGVPLAMAANGSLAILSAALIVLFAPAYRWVRQAI